MIPWKPTAKHAVYFAAVLHAAGVPDVAVVEHCWGCEAEGQLSEPFDVIVACGERSWVACCGS
jgi:hypothetical protein